MKRRIQYEVEAPTNRSPIQRLWRAVLGMCYMDLTDKDANIRSVTENWFFSPEFEKDLEIVADLAIDPNELATNESPVDYCRAAAMRLMVHTARTPFDINEYDGGRR